MSRCRATACLFFSGSVSLCNLEHQGDPKGDESESCPADPCDCADEEGAVFRCLLVQGCFGHGLPEPKTWTASW